MLHRNRNEIVDKGAKGLLTFAVREKLSLQGTFGNFNDSLRQGGVEVIRFFAFVLNGTRRLGSTS